MHSPKVAILASGSGTTAESFISSCVNGEITADVALVISNHKDPGVFEKVRRLNDQHGLNIECIHIGKANFPEKEGEKVKYGFQTEAEEEKILQVLKENDIELVLLLGYMKRVGPKIVDEFGWLPNYESVYKSRMINTHPGLLPETKGLYGLNVQKHVISKGLAVAGHCLFAVDDEYDDGPVISEHSFETDPTEDAEELFERVKESEKKYLAEDIQNFIDKQREYNKIGNNV
ncbi:hypothetical protein HZB74_01380 [Candidatus Saccharibacteria bacterium]|nr:hypothetical protein [Candidatus Saccharibacteria bacterium]